MYLVCQDYREGDFVEEREISKYQRKLCGDLYWYCHSVSVENLFCLSWRILLMVLLLVIIRQVFLLNISRYCYANEKCLESA